MPVAKPAKAVIPSAIQTSDNRSLRLPRFRTRCRFPWDTKIPGRTPAADVTDP